MIRPTLLFLSLALSSFTHQAEARIMQSPTTDKFMFEGIWEGIHPKSGITVQRTFLMVSGNDQFEEYSMLGTVGFQSQDSCVLNGAGSASIMLPSPTSYNIMSVTGTIECYTRPPLVDRVVFEPQSRNVMKEVSVLEGDEATITLYRISRGGRSSCLINLF